MHEIRKRWMNFLFFFFRNFLFCLRYIFLEMGCWGAIRPPISQNDNENVKYFRLLLKIFFFKNTFLPPNFCGGLIFYRFQTHCNKKKWKKLGRGKHKCTRSCVEILSSIKSGSSMSIYPIFK